MAIAKKIGGVLGVLYWLCQLLLAYYGRLIFISGEITAPSSIFLGVRHLLLFSWVANLILLTYLTLALEESLQKRIHLFGFIAYTLLFFWVYKLF